MQSYIQWLAINTHNASVKHLPGRKGHYWRAICKKTTRLKRCIPDARLTGYFLYLLFGRTSEYGFLHGFGCGSLAAGREFKLKGKEAISK